MNRTKQDRDAEGKDQRRKLRGIELHTLDGTQHRDGGRDHPVAIEEGGSNQSDDKQRRSPTSRRGVPYVEKRQQGHNATFAAVVGAHDQDGILERDDQDQRPKDQRHDAHDGVRGGRSAGRYGLLQGVERAGADITVDDTKGGENKHGGGPWGIRLWQSCSL